MAAVYGLTNHVNSKVYVGCTKGKLNKRLREHRCLLRQGKHAEPDLQRDWTLHGEDAFTMEILESLPDDAPTALKRERELWWMDEMARAGRLYNRYRHSYALSPEANAKGVKNAHKKPGKRWTPEANLKRSLSQLGKPKGHGAKISATKRQKRALMEEIV